MIKWFSNKIVKWGLKYDEERRNSVGSDSYGVVVSDSKSDAPSKTVNMERAVRFNVLICQGGVVLEVRSSEHDYNAPQPKSGYGNSEPKIRTHLIPDGEPVAERIGQIVSMEILRNS